mmetsp:Transcript_73812/g.153819  ORF Transcript_73812/g.153819 Transcript_73812/m.153819 type:complete len:529 (-) Transcript_73812:285-1871(-)
MGLAEKASHLSVWILGFCAAIYFLETFDSELKPLVLAFIFVSILEWVVQCGEWVLQKAWVLLCLLLWKAWMSFCWILYKLFRCRTEEHLKAMGRSILTDWGDLPRRWEGGDAGRYSTFRILSVCITLGLVGLLALVLKEVVQTEVSAVTRKFGLYKSQVTALAASLMNFVSEKMVQLPDLVPPSYRNQTLAVIETVDASINRAVDELPSTAEGMGLSMLNAILTQTSSSLFDLVFFMLYSAFMLFDPLHINFDTPEDKGAQKSPTSGGWKDWWRAFAFTEGHRGTPLLQDQSPRSEGDRVRLTEVQYRIYRIVWSYFFLTILLNTIFGVAVFFLMQSLKVDLAVVLAASTFFLSFIPELGAIVAACLPIPFILLTPTEECVVHKHLQDNHHTYYDDTDPTCVKDLPVRFQHVIVAIIGFMAIKLVISNILSAYLIGRNRILAGAVGNNQEEVRETHGVLVMFAVVFFGKVWGVVGMLISVPVISVVRLTLNMGAMKASAERPDEESPFQVGEGGGRTPKSTPSRSLQP